jgi:nucleotide-binding universal stress UspA family protein
MMRFLIPVDGSLHSLKAVRHVVRLATCRETTPEIVLLNVRDLVDTWEVRRFLSDAEIARIQQGEGEDDLGEARALLDDAGLAYRAEVLTGPVAQTIAEYGESQGCDAIVMGSHGRGALMELFLGSVATKVVHLSRIPVTLVK